MGWVSVLQLVPWDTVIANAPKVADAAKKLWNTVGRKPADTPDASAAAQPGAARSPQARLDAVESRLAELHAQMLASSELIKALAEQNAQLVERVEKHRVRVRYLSWAAGIALLLGAGSLGLWLSR